MKRNGQGIELLADPTRRRIVAALAMQPRRPARLARDLAMSKPAVSRQLRLLGDAGLVTWIPSYLDGRARVYLVSPRARGRIIAWLAGTEVGREADWTGPPKPRRRGVILGSDDELDER